jgi:hypothetical protein
MKKLAVVILCVTSFYSCDRINQKIAIKHNDAVIEASDKVVFAFDKLNKALATFDPDSIDIALATYNLQINNSLLELNKAVSVNDTSLKFGTREMLHVFKSVGDNEFKHINAIYHLPDSLYTEKEEKEVNDIASAIDEKIEAAQLKQQNAQKAFAKKFNFELIFDKDSLKSKPQ